MPDTTVNRCVECGASPRVTLEQCHHRLCAMHARAAWNVKARAIAACPRCTGGGARACTRVAERADAFDAWFRAATARGTGDDEVRVALERLALAELARANANDETGVDVGNAPPSTCSERVLGALARTVRVGAEYFAYAAVISWTWSYIGDLFVPTRPTNG